MDKKGTGNELASTQRVSPTIGPPYKEQVLPALWELNPGTQDSVRRLEIEFIKDDQPLSHKPSANDSPAEPALTTAEVRQLLDRLGQGDGNAFWELWLAHQPLVFKVCLARSGGRQADAEDACSSVMQRARDSLRQKSSEIQNLQAWLIRLAVNICTDRYRVDKRRSQGAYNIEATTLDEQPDASIPSARCPDEELSLRELGGTITGAVMALPLRLREAARLFFLEEYSYEQIAVKLKITNANVRKRIQEARTLLKTTLREYGNDHDKPPK